MMKFNKDFNLMIVSFAVSFSFLLTSTLSACPVPKNSLRVPVGQESTYESMATEMKRNTTDISTGSPADNRGGFWSFFKRNKKTATQVVVSEQGYLNESTSIPLELYIPYRKLYRAEGLKEADIMDSLGNPEQMRKIVEKSFDHLEPAKLTDLITRQAPIEQSILELVSNASDAVTGRKAPIGRFGMGALQMLAFIIDENNPPLESGVHITVETVTKSGQGREIVFFKGRDGRIYFTPPKAIKKKKNGTTVKMVIPQGMPVELKNLLQNHLRSRLRLFTKMKVFMNGELLNPLDDHIYLNGERVHYDFDNEEIKVSFLDNEIMVEDHGSGMSDEVIFDKYLIPRLGENEAVPRLSEDEIQEQVHIFYKSSPYSEELTESHIVFQVSGINIQEVTVEGYNLPRELVIQLPSCTKLTISRDGIEIDESTHIAVRLLAEKIIDPARQPAHQFSLINGFMKAVKMLDEKNKRIDVYQSLAETTKQQAFIPYLMKKEWLILPNSPEYHLLEFPENTLFLDEDLIYKITPELIPGSERISSFEPGTFRKAFTVPFKEGAKITYLPLGPYLLINEKIYEKYKNMPFLLNLRLNFYVGYGRRGPEKGRILHPKEFEKRRDLQAALIFEDYPVLKEVLDENQMVWLNEYIKQNSQDKDKIESLLLRLESFVSSIPSDIRDQIRWPDILPFSSIKAGKLKQLLSNQTGFIFPDMDFLTLHINYFLNREHPERIRRYISNLLLPDGMRHYEGHPVFHHMLSQVDARALNYIDKEVLDAVTDVFGKRNLESYEEAFKAINKGLHYVRDDGVKRLILRWLRIYKNDPKSAESFYEKLTKYYKRREDTKIMERGEKHRIINTNNIPDNPSISFRAQNTAYQGVHETTGLEKDGNPIFTVMTGNGTIEFFVFDSNINNIEKIGAYHLDTGYVPNSVEWTGLIDDEGRYIFITSDRYHTSIFSFDMDSGKTEKIIMKEHDHNFDSRFIKKTSWGGPGQPIFMSFDYHTIRLVSYDINSGEMEIIEPQYDRGDTWDIIESMYETNIDHKGKPVFIMKHEHSLRIMAFDLKSRSLETLETLDSSSKASDFMYCLQGKKEPMYISVDENQNIFTFTYDIKKSKFNIKSKSDLSVKRTDCRIVEVENLLDKNGNPVLALTDVFGTVVLFSIDADKGIITILKHYDDIRKAAPEFNISNLHINSLRYDRHSTQLMIGTSSGLASFDLSEAVDGKKEPFERKIREGASDAEYDDIEEEWIPPETRTGFAALDPRDDLSGLPPLVRIVARFLKDKDVAFVEEEMPDQRDEKWEVKGRLSKQVPLGLMNYIFDKFANEIKKNKNISFEEFLTMIENSKDVNISDYVNIIRSAIQGQDKTQRAWVRELIQNARDAMRSEREKGNLGKEEGSIDIRNFIHKGNWIYSIKDLAGMDLWHLLRYYFPLDQSSKDYLKDTGNLGQGNYTLFADFDQVFVRTSTGNGLIHELVIENTEDKGPVITKWDVLKGKYKGTEIRRIKKVSNSDPQLESLFIQESLENFAGAIQPPAKRKDKAEEPLLRDFEILYNGESFSDDIEMLSEIDMGDGWGRLAIGRCEDRNRRRVMQDELFIKSPDNEELRFVPKRILNAFERFGGIHISIGKEILLNIPRTGYSQKHKFLHRLQIGVLHNIMKAILKDYMERNALIYAMPPDYFSNEIVRDNPEAQEIAGLMYKGEYEKITEEMIVPFIQDPIKFFELISHIPFTSRNHNGEINLHRLRELRMEENKIRRARAEREFWDRWRESVSLATIFEGKKLGSEFSYDFGGEAAIEGKIASESRQTSYKEPEIPELPVDKKEYFLSLNAKLLKPIVGNDMPKLGFFAEDSNVRAHAGVQWGVPVLEWNLAHIQGEIERLYDLSKDSKSLQEELKSSYEEGLIGRFLSTLIHESQHLPKFERPGDHTHHSDETVDNGFSQRMGRAFDLVLHDVDNFVELFVNPLTGVAHIVQEQGEVDLDIGTTDLNSLVVHRALRRCL